jgi:hypothetical protein
VIGGTAATGVVPYQSTEIEHVHDLHDKTRQMVLRQPVFGRRRKR